MTDKLDSEKSFDALPSKKLLVMVDKYHLESIDSLADQLEYLGMTVEMKLTSTGMITGSASGGLVESLSNVKGVEFIREDGEMSVFAERQHGELSRETSAADRSSKEVGEKSGVDNSDAGKGGESGDIELGP